MTPVWLVLGAILLLAHGVVLILAKAATMGDEQMAPDWDAAFAKYLRDVQR